MDMQTSRIERRRIEFRDKIMRAALKLFEQQGVADTSVASIIKEADIAHKTFFNHFPSKDHLLQHIVSSYIEQGYAYYREKMIHDSAPQERIAYCLNSIAAAIDDLHPHYKELMSFYLTRGSEFAKLRAFQREDFLALVQEIMRDAARVKILRAGFSETDLTDMVVNICTATLLNWAVEDDYPLIPKMKKAVKFVNASVFVEP